ncbi:hypothetical protein Tco_0683809 [Tanacetum coccineum]
MRFSRTGYFLNFTPLPFVSYLLIRKPNEDEISKRAGPSLSVYNYDSSNGKRALDSLPVLPPNCTSENPATIHEFLEKGKAALVFGGIVRDTLGA